MTKKLAVIGKGSAGAISAAHFNRWTDWEIEWYHDPGILPQAVGEGSTLAMPKNLLQYFDFSHEDLEKIDGSFKTGIAKEGWGETGEYFFHNFFPPELSYHFSAVKLQEYIMNQIKDQVKIIEKNVTHNDIDVDHIVDCTGRPKDLEDFIVPKYIPVNAVHVTQCFWDYPRFQHTFAIAKKHGWVFGIPLRNRCSVGYLYNQDISSLEEVKEDVQELFERYNLIPSNTTNSFQFGNYYRKQNFTNRVAYNGNASFFLEPLEATSFVTMDLVNRTAWDIWKNNWTPDMGNNYYTQALTEVENMIMMHYFAGSKHKTPFWEYAQQRGSDCMREATKDSKFIETISNAVRVKNFGDAKTNYGNHPEYGTWSVGSYFQNINGLGIKNKLLSVINHA